MLEDKISQEMFEIAVRGVLTQKGVSYDTTKPACKYRYRGNKCMVGHLISDDELDSIRSAVGKRNFEVRATTPDMWPERLSGMYGDLVRLQTYHDMTADKVYKENGRRQDTAKFKKMFRQRMERWASGRGLKMPEGV